MKSSSSNKMLMSFLFTLNWLLVLYKLMLTQTENINIQAGLINPYRFDNTFEISKSYLWQVAALKRVILESPYAFNVNSCLMVERRFTSIFIINNVTVSNSVSVALRPKRLNLVRNLDQLKKIHCCYVKVVIGKQKEFFLDSLHMLIFLWRCMTVL